MNEIELNIETLILVAIWKKPFIFQGQFTITNQNDNTSKSLFFRCECNLQDKMDILDADFSPANYKFTHLYNEKHSIDLANLEVFFEEALYTLMFALNLTLKLLLERPDQPFISVDEITLSAISQTIEESILQAKKNKDDDIGFAVAVDCNLPENIAAILFALTDQPTLLTKSSTAH